MAARIAFIGAGNMASAHLDGLSRGELAELVAVADPQEALARDVCGKHGGRAFADYRTMLDSCDLDAVFVCVPPSAHGQIETDLATRGLHLFVEKPVHRDVGRAAEIADAIEQAGVISATGYVLRYFPFYDQLAAVLSEMTVRQAVIRRWHTNVPRGLWQRRMDQSGGQVLEQLTHQIDLVRALAGEIRSVAASYAYNLPRDADADIPSNSTIMMTLDDGASVVCTAGFGCAADHNDLQILTDRGLIEVDYESGATIEPGGAANVPPLASVEEPWSHALVTGDRAFLDAVATGDSSSIRTGYRDAVRTLAVSVACNLAAREGRSVDLAELTP